MDWLTKASDATSLHRATLGRANTHGFHGWSWETGRVDPELLVRRYAMWVHRCIGINASTAAGITFSLMTTKSSDTAKRYGDQMSFMVKTREPTTGEKAYLRGEHRVKPSETLKARVGGNPDDLTVIETGPVLGLLNNVNPWTDGYAWRESIYADLQIFGRAFEHVVGEGDAPDELWRMMPQKTKVERDAAEFVSAFLYGSGPDEQTYAPDEVIWFKLFDPFDPWGGMGPLEAWLKTVDASMAIASFQDDLFKRFGVPDYIIKTKADLDQGQKRAFRKDWRRMFGKLWRRQENIAFMGGEGEIERLGQTNKELEFTQSSDQIRDYIGQAFGVPKALLTTDDVNRANLDGSRELHIETTIWPLVQRVEDTLNEQLVKRFGDGLFIVHESPIKEDQTIRIADRASKLASGWSVNEIRVDEGVEALLDPLADEPMVSAAFHPLSMVLPPEPEEGEDVADVEEVPAGETSQATVLQGAQITAATAIIQAVADNALPVDSARGQLVVMFNLTPEQANLMLGGVDTFEAEKPEPPPMIPGQAPPLPPGAEPPDDEPSEEEEEPEERSILFTIEQVDALLKAAGGPQPIQVAVVNSPVPVLEAVEAATVESVEVVKQSDLMTFKGREAGEIADDAFDGYVNSKFAADVDKELKREIKAVIKTLLAAGVLEPSEINPDDLIRSEGWAEVMAEVAKRHVGVTLTDVGQGAIDSLTAKVETTFSLENIRAKTYLDTSSRRIGKDVTDTWRTQIRGELIAGTSAGENTRQIAKRIEAMTNLTPAKAEMVSRTETAFASVNATEMGWDQSGVVVGKQFVLAPDACPWCEAVAAEVGGDGRSSGVDVMPPGKVFPLGQPLFDVGKELEAQFPNKDGEMVTRRMVLDYTPDDTGLSVPPVHPHCRCSMRPILDDEVS